MIIKWQLIKKFLLILFVVVCINFFVITRYINDPDNAVTRNDGSFEYLINKLYYLNAFIIDDTVLTKISQSHTHSDIYVHDSVLVDQYHITFGVFNESFNFRKLYALNYKVLKSYGKYVNRTVLTNLYVKVGSVYTIQLAIFYKRGLYHWIGADENPKYPTKSFGDVPRGINVFPLKTLRSDGFVFIVPKHINSFIYQYSFSKFIECNYTLAEESRKLMNVTNDDKRTVRDLKFTTTMSEIAQIFESNYLHYWLAGGTILGWYRDCGIIPHTTDADIAVLAKEFTPSVLRTFRGHPTVPLFQTMGFLNQSFEFRIVYDNKQIDVFLIYDYNSTYKTYGYYLQKKRFTRIGLPIDDYCSGEILKSKFMVPCDPVKHLTFEYGTYNGWAIPNVYKYKWFNLNRKYHIWSDSIWPDVIKVYRRNGILNVKDVLFYLNTKTNFTITEEEYMKLLNTDKIKDMVKY